MSSSAINAATHEIRLGDLPHESGGADCAHVHAGRIGKLQGIGGDQGRLEARDPRPRWGLRRTCTRKKHERIAQLTSAIRHLRASVGRTAGSIMI